MGTDSVNVRERLTEILRSTERGNDVREWPADEAAAYRDNDGFSEGLAAAHEVRASNAVDEILEVVVPSVEDLKRIIDPEAWDDDYPKSAQFVAEIQWGLRRKISTEYAERVHAALMEGHRT